MLASMSDLPAKLAGIDGVDVSESVFKAGLGYWVNGKEIAHVESDTVIDIRLTRAAIRRRRAELRADGRVRMRPGSSDWVAVETHGPHDEAFVLQLVEIAAEAHRATAGTRPAPPPPGPDLDRRRRFH
jgi:hypothetical protein